MISVARTARVYCHRACDRWPAEPGLLEAVAVNVKGGAIDLVFDRRQENRSQFIFAWLKEGREAIFWQSARTTKESRSGVRIAKGLSNSVLRHPTLGRGVDKITTNSFTGLDIAQSLNVRVIDDQSQSSHPYGRIGTYVRV